MATEAERRRLVGVVRAATRFYRRELFRDKTGWARRYLESGQSAEVLAPESKWFIGYAPAARSRLVDHLRSQGFDHAAMRNAGLAVVGADGSLIDRFRDQLMFPARSADLETTGFVGMHGTGESLYYRMSPATQVHRASSSLVGVAEQFDLLQGEAVPVLVRDPLDALAIERTGRMDGGRWAGIPLCGAVLSADQASLLSAYTLTDTVIVLVPDLARGQETAVECLGDLARSFSHVRAVELPRGRTPSSLWMASKSQRRLRDELLRSRPLADYLPKRRQRRVLPPANQSPPHHDAGPTLDL